MVLSVSEPDSAVQSANPPPNPLSAPAVAPLQAIPATGNVDLQSTLLALLSKAANSVGANGTLTSQTAPNIAVAPPVPAPVLDANQLALLQHLAQAAQGNVMSTLPAVPVLPPSVVPNAVDVVPPVHRDEPVPASGSNQLPYYQDDRFGHASASASASAYAPHPESEQQPQHMHGGRFDGPPDRGYPRDDYYDQSQHQPAASHPHEYGGNDPRRGGAYGNTHRGGYRDRGGPGPGRGRGRGRRDDYGGDRDYNDHDHGDSYGTAPNGSYDHPRGFGRRSRSRSPPGRFRGGSGGGGRGMNGNGRGRDARPYSPPRRPRNRGRSRGGGRDKVDANIAAGFDEFGRELRAASPARSMAGSETASASASASAGPLPTLGERSRGESPLPPGSVTTSDRGSSAPEHPSQAFEVGGGGGMHRSYSDHQDYRSSPDLSTSTPYQTSPSSMSMSTAHPGTEGGGLDGFDRASFDPSQASSWDALGKAWTATHGSMPSQEELMQFVFGNVSLPPSGSGQSAGQSEDLYGGADGPGGSPQQSRRQLHEEGEQQWTSGRGYGQQRGGWRGRGGGGGDGDAGRGYGRGRGGGDYGRGRGASGEEEEATTDMGPDENAGITTGATITDKKTDLGSDMDVGIMVVQAGAGITWAGEGIMAITTTPTRSHSRETAGIILMGRRTWSCPTDRRNGKLRRSPLKRRHLTREGAARERCRRSGTSGCSFGERRNSRRLSGSDLSILILL
ncbi:hypothetical protein C8Q80DRAFT_247181 [Daedaleopsis nitida]|nr:hypothetical protein C8Q80DRAFT_247181 [Daedaleopsis nitida]